MLSMVGISIGIFSVVRLRPNNSITRRRNGDSTLCATKLSFSRSATSTSFRLASACFGGTTSVNSSLSISVASSCDSRGPNETGPKSSREFHTSRGMSREKLPWRATVKNTCNSLKSIAIPEMPRRVSISHNYQIQNKDKFDQGRLTLRNYSGGKLHGRSAYLRYHPPRRGAVARLLHEDRREDPHGAPAGQAGSGYHRSRISHFLARRS